MELLYCWILRSVRSGYQSLIWLYWVSWKSVIKTLPSKMKEPNIETSCVSVCLSSRPATILCGTMAYIFSTQKVHIGMQVVPKLKQFPNMAPFRTKRAISATIFTFIYLAYGYMWIYFPEKSKCPNSHIFENCFSFGTVCMPGLYT